MLRTFRFTFFMMLLLFAQQVVFAAVEPYQNFLKGSIKAGDSLFVKDEKFKNPSFNWADITNISVKNAISLQVLDEQPISQSFSCKLTFRVEYFSSPTQTEATRIDSVALNIHYDKTAGAVYKGMDTYRFENGYFVKVYVISVSSPEFGSQLPPVLQLVNSINIDRKYAFKPFLFIGINAQTGSGSGRNMQRLSSGTPQNQNNQLLLSWQLVVGAEEYDIEWVTVDEGSEWETMAANLNGGAYSDAELNELFRNNATRVTTHENNYTISLLYSSSYILVRMRQVQYTDGLRNEGTWFYKQDNNSYAVWPLNWHQSNLNWQYAATYAEEGKKKEVVSYFDGSLRGRQTVTLQNSDGVAVVQENVYDEFGRAAASILPAPVKEAINTQYLHYFPYFNQNSNSQPYSFADLNAANCEPLPGMLSNGSGAAKYYSNQNPFLNASNYNKYIPDAGGYPLSVTQYTPDNTGRIKLQGGVGSTFQPGTPDQHTTRYFYGKPEQWELDRLFGNDVGYAEHYLKNMVVDPNGQISISYLNAAGKTIATALTGNTPANVSALDSKPAAQSVQMKLLKPEQFSFDGSKRSLNATTTYTASVTGPVTLQYDIQKLISTYRGGDFKPCSNCYYELEIIIKDHCNNVVFNLAQPVQIGSPTTNCNDLGTYSGTVQTAFNQIGEYYIHFNFRLDDQVIRNFTDQYISKGQDSLYIYKKADFVKQNLLSSQFKDCFSDCRSARVKLGTKAGFTAMFQAKLIESGEQTADYSSLISSIYDGLLAEVTTLESSCVTPSPCDIYQNAMLGDVSPGGQFAMVDESGNLSELSTNVLQLYFRNGAFTPRDSSDIVYRNNLVTKEDGSISSPYAADFDLNDLVKYWKPEWAEQFLPFHPEYCKLQFCNQNAASKQWDQQLKDQDQAAPAGYNRGNAVNWLLQNDPFFAAGAAGHAYRSSLENDLVNFSTVVLGRTDVASKDLNAVVDYMLYCADQTGTTNINGSTDLLLNWNNCAPRAECRIADREWQLFRDQYLQLKDKYYNQAVNANCSGACTVGQPLSSTYQNNPNLPVQQESPAQSFYYGPCPDTDFFAVADYRYSEVYGQYGVFVHVQATRENVCDQSVDVSLLRERNGYMEYLGGTTIYPGQDNANLFVQGYMDGNDIYYACGVLCTPEPTSNCPAIYADKVSRFEPQISAGTTDGNQYESDQHGALSLQIRSSCEGQAETWIQRLQAGLDAGGFTPDQISLLKSSLINLCFVGGDLSHPFGASTLPGNVQPIQVNGQNAYSFADVIRYSLGISSFTNLLNPWLIDSPYPYDQPQQATEAYVSATTSALCTTLGMLRPGGYGDHDFYVHLQNTYGAAMTLSEAEFNTLLKGCNHCRHLLDDDLKLPVFLRGNGGCIARSVYQASMATLNSVFGGSLDPGWSNYETIVKNFLNQSHGLTLSYEDYRAFAAGANPLLCNNPPFVTVPEDPMACAKALIEVAYATGSRDYDAYIAEERTRFTAAYINTCAAAKANVQLTASQQTYHYTLYYYDQAGNLVRTVPPEGVTLLSEEEMVQVQRDRAGQQVQNCNYNEALIGYDRHTALQNLSTVLQHTGSNALEMWLYTDQQGDRQFISATPDHKYMVQACINGSLVNVDIFTLNQTAPDQISITLSNHVTANVSDILPLAPWTHLVIQGTDLSRGVLQIWVNGKAYSPVPGAPSAGCSWAISSSPGVPVALPDNLSRLKHLRTYTGRLMSAAEIAANAASPCFGVSNENALAWYRFNIPAAGSSTTIAENSTRETQFNGTYPLHLLTTTYAYNATNQVVQQQTPDAGISKFWYDYLSRLVFSQNARQAPRQEFSYTSYDAQGRITEVGKKNTSVNPGLPGYLSDQAYTNVLYSGSNAEITQTFYDQVTFGGNGMFTNLDQQNLRKRVAASVYRETPGTSAINASYYSYDLGGNVKTLYQQVSGLGMKQLDYEYDQVSGKVNFLAYQKNANDRFFYQYKYDAENRLTEAWSSTEANLSAYGFGSTLTDPSRRLDASYQYYLHGPLARMELGRAGEKVQGVDYAYTLQGWLKGVNGTALNGPGSDVGMDGAVIGRDVLAYSLGYYNGDYSPVGGGSAFAHMYQGNNGDLTGRPLFNGNISNSTYAIAKINNGATVGYSYGYDQLNRIKNVNQHDMGSGNWSFASAGNKFKESFSYDGNGNLLNLNRNNQGGGTMDNLGYAYNRDASGRLVNNRLAAVNDALGVTNGSDIGSSSYTYDEIGNLKTDAAEGISNIDWTVYGKIKLINKNSGNISYTYDPSGNRVSKTFNGLTTYYLRDAQGNSLAVYDNAGNTSNWREQQLYGSSRLGMWKPNVNLATANGTSIWNSYGLKFFELSNHLGNVMAVVSDTRIQAGSTYEADVVNSNDYYAFGGQMQGRDFTNPGAQAYRYGFNGKENDNEVKGTGNQQDYGMRIYDPRIGKFLSTDPITAKYPFLTPYQFASNRPIGAVDLDGLEAKDLMNGKTIIFPSMTKLKQLKSDDYLLWKDMLLFEKSDKYSKVLKQAENLGEAVTRQEMDWAASDRLNTDYYAVNITKLPAGMTEAAFMNHIRQNFGEYLNHQRFSPDGWNPSASIWKSDNPTGSIMVFRDWRDNAAVLTTQSSKNHWVFTPIGTAWQWEHPLAGHREFGLTKNDNGSYTFYTRGVDMLWDAEDVVVAQGIFNFFGIADKLWNGVMDNIATEVNKQGGSAVKTHSFSRKIDWKTDVKKDDK